jgi:hypothetical protein
MESGEHERRAPMPEQKPTPAGKGAGEPTRVRLPGFITDEEVGFGDVVKRATSAVGIRPCGGCQRRADALNRWLVFSKRGRS